MKKTVFQSMRGITLVELLIVLAIVLLLVATIVPSLAAFRKQQALQNTTNAIVGLLQEARSKTLASYETTFFSVYFDTATATLFSGGTYNASDQTNKVISFETPVTLQSTALTGGGATISFDRLKGTTSNHGTITVGISGGDTRTVSVNASGMITRN
jgi:Tfp pilus assembly protein FimT